MIEIIVGVIILVLDFMVIIFVLWKRVKKDEEEPGIDDNMYYGDDYDDYDENNNIVDTNDYYVK